MNQGRRRAPVVVSASEGHPDEELDRREDADARPADLGVVVGVRPERAFAFRAPDLGLHLGVRRRASPESGCRDHGTELVPPEDVQEDGEGSKVAFS